MSPYRAFCFPVHKEQDHYNPGSSFLMNGSRVQTRRRCCSLLPLRCVVLGLLVLFVAGGFAAAKDPRDDKKSHMDECSSTDNSGSEAQPPHCRNPVFDNESAAENRLESFLTHMESLYAKNQQSSRAATEKLALTTLLEHVGMDPTLLDQRPLPWNWMEELHRRVKALAAPAFWKVYLTRPSDDDFATIVGMDRYAQQQATNLKELQAYAFAPHRDRGMVAALSVSFAAFLGRPLQHFVGYATPTNQLLKNIADRYSPIVEMGAGNGYWSAALEQLYGADVVAYDVAPPIATGSSRNGTTNVDDENPNEFSFATQPFTKVQESSCTALFRSTTTITPVGQEQRSLLLIWPNNPDPIDNPKHANDHEIISETWDVECLQSYLEDGGRTVIFVGERESQIQVRPNFPPDCGMTATREFQALLEEQFSLVERHEILTWWGADDVTIWQRRRVSS